MDQTFRSRVNKRQDQERQQQKVRITLETQDDDTGDITFSEAYTFTRPSEGRLFLMATAFGASSRPENAAAEVDATLEEMLLDRAPGRNGDPGKGEREFLLLRRRIGGPVESRIEIEDMMEILGQLVEHWSDGFPTQPSSGSSEGPGSTPTGGRSTGRVHSPASTRSTSDSDDFSPSFTPGSLEG
jgi:hypothetical protein